MGHPCMTENTLTPARERHVARGRATAISRVVAAMHLAIDGVGLSNTEALIALNDVLEEKLGKPHRSVYVRRDQSHSTMV